MADIPLAPMPMQPEQDFVIELCKVDRNGGLSALGSDAIDSTVRTIPIGIRIGMRGPGIIPVRHIDRTLWPHRHIRRREPRVVSDQQLAAMGGLDCRAARLNGMPIDAVPEQVSCNVSIAKSFRKRIALIYDAADRHMPTAEVLMRRVVEVAIGMGIMQSSVLSKRFY